EVLNRVGARWQLTADPGCRRPRRQHGARREEPGGDRQITPGRPGTADRRRTDLCPDGIFHETPFPTQGPARFAVMSPSLTEPRSQGPPPTRARSTVSRSSVRDQRRIVGSLGSDAMMGGGGIDSSGDSATIIVAPATRTLYGSSSHS